MDGILLAIFVVGLIIILILLIYLVDRVNQIERETRGNHGAVAKATALSAGPYFGLGGRKLWDAMTEHPPSGIDAAEWANVRQRYALALQLHIESIFEEGQRDGQRGMLGEPKNPRVISTPEGNLESWLPPTHVKSMYQCGVDSVTQPEEVLMGVRASLNEAGKSLYMQAGFTQFPTQSDLLLPGPMPPLPSLVDPLPSESVASSTQTPAGALRKS
ncbi:MAG: hypothetical protein RIT26_1851 [Pseudomonadota bacterium]|jgi:hypothetical protein